MRRFTANIHQAVADSRRGMSADSRRRGSQQAPRFPHLRSTRNPQSQELAYQLGEPKQTERIAHPRHMARHPCMRVARRADAHELALQFAPGSSLRTFSPGA